jgi:hypothetical protein
MPSRSFEFEMVMDTYVFGEFPEQDLHEIKKQACQPGNVAEQAQKNNALPDDHA